MTLARLARAAAVCVVLASCSGCVSSIRPFFRPESRVTEPAVLGVWSIDDGALIVRPGADSLTYDVVFLDLHEKEVLHYEAGLARFGGKLFADVAPSGGLESPQPTNEHMAFLIELKGDSLRFEMSEDEEMTSLLEPASQDSADAYDGILVPAEGKAEVPHLLMVTSSESLENFLQKCATHDEVWGSGAEWFKRIQRIE